MQEIFGLMKKVAVVDCNVLLQGEIGTGSIAALSSYTKNLIIL